jgi:uncharacterized cupin superfamily protein
LEHHAVAPRRATPTDGVDHAFRLSSGLNEIDIEHQLLPSGRSTSLPHARCAEEDLIHVIDGTADV